MVWLDDFSNSASLAYQQLTNKFYKAVGSYISNLDTSTFINCSALVKTPWQEQSFSLNHFINPFPGHNSSLSRPWWFFFLTSLELFNIWLNSTSAYHIVILQHIAYCHVISSIWWVNSLLEGKSSTVSVLLFLRYQLYQKSLWALWFWFFFCDIQIQEVYKKAGVKVLKGVSIQSIRFVRITSSSLNFI